MSMRASVGRRKSTNVIRHPPSKLKLDSESDSESLPDVLGEDESASVSGDEEKENRSVMSSTDNGQRPVKSHRLRARKQNTTTRIPQKGNAEIRSSESLTDIFDSQGSDADCSDREGSSEGHQDKNVDSKLQTEAKIVAKFILEKEKDKSSATVNHNGGEKDSAMEEEAVLFNGVNGARDDGALRETKDSDEDGNIPNSQAPDETRCQEKTNSKEKSTESDVEIIEDSTDDRDEEVESAKKKLWKKIKKEDEKGDNKVEDGGVKEGWDKRGGRQDDTVDSKTTGKVKNVRENGNDDDDGDESSNDEAAGDKGEETSRRKQGKGKIRKVEEDCSGGEMESEDNTEEESENRAERKKRLKAMRKKIIYRRNKGKSDSDGEDDESTLEEDETNQRQLRKRKNEESPKIKLERRRRKVSEDDESSSDEDGEKRYQRKLRRGRKNHKQRDNDDSSQVDQSSNETDASSEASLANDFIEDFKGIRCTSCFQQLNQYNRKSLCRHPTLDVLICRRCIEYYHEGEFTQDSEGADEQCQWCGEGGNLICCDFCPSAFCKICICRNLSRKEWLSVSTNEVKKWHCYVCDKKPIADLIKSCRVVIRWAEKSAKGSATSSKTVKRESRAREVSARPYKQLCAFLEGRSENWNFFQNALEQNKKLSSQMTKKGLLHTVLNIRSFRKYLKSYQNHFEKGLEEIMSSGEISGGETATDSMTAKEDAGSKENGDVDEKECGEEGSDDEETTPKKRDKQMRRMKTTPKRNSVASDREKRGDDQAGPHGRNSSDDDDATTMEEEEDEGMKEGPDEETRDNSSEQKNKVEETEALGKKNTRKKSKESKVSRKNDEDGEETDECEKDGDGEKTSDGKGEEKINESTKSKEGNATVEKDVVDLIEIEDNSNIILTDENEDGESAVKKDEERQVCKNVSTKGKKEVRRSESDEDEKPQRRDEEDRKQSNGVNPEITSRRSQSDEDKKSQSGDEEDRKQSNGVSPDESGNSMENKKKVLAKNDKEKRGGEVVKEDGNQKDLEAKKEEDGVDSDDDFEKMLMEDIESNEEDSCKVDKKGSKDSKEKDEAESSDEGVRKSKTAKAKGVKARKSLSEEYKKDEEGKSKGNTSRYVETGSTSDSEVSLIDVDIADEQERKKKKQKKRQKKMSDSDSDTEEEVEKLAQKATKRKKETDGDSQEDVEQRKEPKKESEKKNSSKRMRKESSGSDIDGEIDRLDDLTFQGSQKGKSRGKKQQSKPKDKKKKSGTTSITGDDSDEELPEINYDTDPEIMIVKSEKKKAIKFEDAEEAFAENMLVKDLESDGKDKGELSDSSSDSEGDKNGEGKKNSKGASEEGKNGKKGGSENGQKGSKKATDGSDNDNKSSQSEKPGKNKKSKQVHKLLKGKLISSSSSSDSDEEWNKKKKKLNDMVDKDGKSSESGRKKKRKKGKKGDSDSDFTISDSSDSSVGMKKKKRRSKTQSSGGESSDGSVGLQKLKKRNRKETGSDSDKGSSDDFAAERKKLRSYQLGHKDKKKSRIRQACTSGSDSDNGRRKQRRSDDSGSEIADSQEKGKGRKKIRKVMKKAQLAQETIDAAEEEKERRKRIQKKRQEIIAREMDSPQKSSALQEIILDRDLETNEGIIEVDKKLVKVLKPHQAKGIQFMWDCTFETVADAEKSGSGCILAHCMGLGKTLQVIAFLHSVMREPKLGVNTALVVAPLNTVLNWEAEFEKWQDGLEYEINVFELASYKDNANRADKLKHWQREGGVMIMGYTMYRNLCQSRFVKKKKQKEVFAETLVDPGPDLVVCDEGHLLKNDTTATARALNNIRTQRRICLTGTPLQNNLIEYHCMVQFVKPRLLGTRKEFSNRFVNPISNGQCADSSPYDVKLMKKRAHILHNLLSGSVQRKDYSALAPYLPPKHEFVVLIRLSKKQIELYERYLGNCAAGSAGGALEGRPSSLFKDYQVLMNVWTHPRLLKLAAIRTEKKRQSEEMKSFIDDVETEVDSSEEDEVVEQVRDSSSEDELMRAVKEKKLAEIMNAPGTSGEQNNGKPRKKKSGGDDSDSSVEVIKTWNTRRTRGDGEDDFLEEFEPPPPKKEWFTDLVNDEDGLKIEISGKMVLLFEILKLAEAVGEKVLVFSQSLLTLDLIEDLLEDQALKNVADNAEKRRIKLASSEEIEIEMEAYDTWVKGVDYFRIDGSTEAHTRKAMADKFNKLENIRSRLFLVSTRAGSLGINLVAASRVIIFDACWNPSHDIQSIFRVYRFGQEKAVYIYRFIAQGTMEERIYDRQVTKQSLAQRVVDEHQVKRHYTFTELNELYNFQPDRLDDPDRKEQPTPILPKDFILAELLHCQKDWIVNYHEHDSLLENVVDESLTEEERKAAWAEYEAEKEGHMLQMTANPGMNQPPGLPVPMREQLLNMQQGVPTFNHSLAQQYAQVSQAQYNNPNNVTNMASLSPFMSMARILQLSKQAQQNQMQNRPQVPTSYSVRIPGISQPVVTHRIPPPSMNLRPGLPGHIPPGLPGQPRPGVPGQARPGQPGMTSSSFLMQALSRQAQVQQNNVQNPLLNPAIRVPSNTPQPPGDGSNKS